MADFKKITAFYVPIGSPDYPKSWSPTEKFGFLSQAGTGPVYNTDLYTVMNIFKNPITFMKKFSISSDPVSEYISQMIFGKPSDSFLNSSVTTDGTNNRYTTIMMILDYLFINQYSTSVVNNFNNNVSVILGARSSHYSSPSLIVSQNDVDASRLNYVCFDIDFSDDTLTHDFVTIKVYFNPDELLANESKDRKKVFVYEDTDNDEYITKEEWQTQIINKHKDDIFADARYTKAECKVYNYHYNDTAGDEQTIPRYFFVYSLIDLSVPDLVNTIQEFVLNDNGGNLTICKFKYPDLFTNANIYIYPIEIKRSSLSLDYISPVSYKTFKDVLDSNSVNEDDNNFINSELFFIGSENANIDYSIPLSAIAVNSDIGSSIGPISIGFPNYSPIFKSINYATETENAVKFHKLVRLALSVIYGIIQPDNSMINDINNSSSVNFTSEVLSSGSYKVTFVLNGNTYIVKKSV